jgi:hypothetical protein
LVASRLLGYQKDVMDVELMAHYTEIADEVTAMD